MHGSLNECKKYVLYCELLSSNIIIRKCGLVSANYLTHAPAESGQGCVPLWPVNSPFDMGAGRGWQGGSRDPP